MRLDLLLVQRGLAKSREKARALIMAGLVEVNESRLDKPGYLAPISSSISLKEVSSAFVSRGGLKLEAAVDHFAIPVRDKVFLDVGASTGGFTDCLLRKGVLKVICVDVGYGQLDWRLRRDPRVTVLERTNIRHLGPLDLREEIHGAVIDVSFISLKLVVPAVSKLLLKKALMLALIKPQFEVGKGRVGKGGVVRDPRLHQEVIDGISDFFRNSGWTVEGVVDSPLLGPKGNREFFIYVKR
jgi:23S rRNA (cytidine1920-2'-O)/16S rRNA (cytidine1409-2'-O)-methyltransferase